MKLSQFELVFLITSLVTLVISIIAMMESFLFFISGRIIQKRKKIFFLLEIITGFFGIFLISVSMNLLSMSDTLDSWFVFSIISLIWIIYFVRIFVTKTKFKTTENRNSLNSDDIEIPFSNQEENENDELFQQQDTFKKNIFVNFLLEVKNFPQHLYRSIKGRILFFVFGLSILISLCSILVFFSSKCCILGNPFHFSTSFSRKLGQGRICQTESVCHTYFTVPEDLSTSISLKKKIFFLLFSKL